MKKITFLATCLLFTLNLVHAQHSVLSSGNWYKFGVKEEGIYCITAADLSAVFPIPVSNAQNIQLFGNTAGMQPLRFDQPHVDDLKEIPIIIKGESDGSFDAGDTIFFYSPSADKRLTDSNSKTFSLQKNIYSDSVYFFLTVGNSIGKRINSNATLFSFTNSSNSYNEFYWHEVDSVNLIQSGKLWFGEKFDISFPTRNFSFDFSHIIPGDSLIIRADYAGRNLLSAGNTRFEISYNSYNHSKLIPLTGSSPQDPYAIHLSDSLVAGPPVNSGVITCTLITIDSISSAYLNYLSVNFISSLDIYRPQQIFSDLNSVGAGNVTNYTLNVSNQTTGIWDITDPLNPLIQQFNSSPTTISYNVANDSAHTYVAFDNHMFFHIGTIRPILNQDLHAMSQADYLIISSEEFLSQANTLASFRRSHDGLQTILVSTDQIYNEYSAGSQDPVAIRNFISHIYDTSATTGDTLQNVLLFGNGSFDHRGRLGFHSSFVPSYQSNESLKEIGSYTYEDFFTYMNDTATDYFVNKPAFGIGRIPATNIAEASVVNRIITYSTSNTFGDWRKKYVAIADDQDHNTWFQQVDTICNRLENYYCEYDISKIHIDAFPQVSTAQGDRYPDVNVRISEWLNNGCLAMNFMGHGGRLGWATERVLDTTMLLSAANNDRSPLIIGVTAEQNKFDDPTRSCIGKTISTNPTGCGIASISDSRIGFSSSLYSFFMRLDSILFAKRNNQHLRLGDIMRNSKLKYTDPYTQSLCLLGDPALMLNYPSNEIFITAINGNATSTIPDTLIPGQSVQIDGEVRDINGNLMTNFNGQVNLLLFDQQTMHMTLGNDSGSFDVSIPAPYYSWDDTVNYITANVTAGIFSASFNIAWDLDSAIGNGKLSTYAFDSNTDASGCYENFVYRNLTFGIDDPDAVSVNIFPNPSNDKITFELSDQKTNLHFILVNASGEIIISHELKENKFIVSKNELSRGIYFYRITDEKSKLIKRGKIVFE